MKTKIHSQFKMHLMNITKIDKYEKNWTAVLWRSTKHMNITKYKKLNMTEHKTDMNITKIDKYKKTEQQFYNGAQNRYEHY